MEPGDCDGDGHRHYLECGGDDCDDSDADRYPGNAEVCDEEGHDEDCNPDTVAGDHDGDFDGDGYISSMCCNGDNCGDDCDDRAREIFPGAREICNGIDDDCDGNVDEAGAFCPVGICVDRRCRALGWEKVFGSATVGYDVTPRGITVDADGNSYLMLRGTMDVDGDGVTESTGAYVVSFAADGRYRWHTSVPDSYARDGHGFAAGSNGTDLVVIGTTEMEWLSLAGGETVRTTAAPSVMGWDGATIRRSSWFNDELYVMVPVFRNHPSDPMEAPAQGILLLRLDGQGMEIGRRLIEGAADRSFVRGMGLAVSRAGLAVIGVTDAPITLDPEVELAGNFIVRFDHDLSTVWGVSNAPPALDVAISGDGEVALVGAYEGSYMPFWGGARWESTDADDTRHPDTDAFILLLSSDGAHVWHRVHDGPDYDTFTFVDFDGREGVMVGGIFTGYFARTPGIGGNVVANGSDGLFGVFGAPDGYILDARAFSGAAGVRVLDAEVDAYGNLALMGTFFDDVTLPSGTTYVASPFSSNAWVVRIADIP